MVTQLYRLGSRRSSQHVVCSMDIYGQCPLGQHGTSAFVLGDTVTNVLLTTPHPLLVPQSSPLSCLSISVCDVHSCLPNFALLMSLTLTLESNDLENTSRIRSVAREKCRSARAFVIGE